MDIGDWLRDLGLERYAAAFRENEVGADLLPRLTAQDLQDLGVAAVGHRRRLLDAIAALRGEDGPAGDRVSKSEAERRHITVLFCDLVGSTPLSTRLDPEDLRQLLDRYRTSVVSAVTSKRGYVARFAGDGVLAYFGWPNADEAHADSAVRAALATVEAVRPHLLSVRVGIATGLVVVGDLIGAGAAQEHPAIGETPNLAARLQALAEPDTVVVSEATRSQLGRLFDLEALGPVALKGFDRPVRAWRARGETGPSSRSEAVYASAVAPLVGREEELDLLLRRWRQAKAGEGRVVLLSGEAGIGKSRLLAALEDRLTGELPVRLRYFCSSHHQDSALHPVIARLEQEAGFTRGDSAGDRLAKLEAMLAPTAPTPEEVALLAALLSVPTEGRYPALELSPRRRKERTFAALIRRLASFARKGPVLVLFEDAHWSDPTSLELLDAVIERVPDLPVLLVASFRPEFAAPWFGRPGVSLATLSRLDRRDATTLARQIVADHVLSSGVLDRIVAQADGVPLFIEELTKAVVETTELDAAGATLAVPDTLQASLMARLDRLPMAKQVAQIGSVIGREFPHTLLSAVADLPEPQFAQGIEKLVASGLVFCRGAPPDAVYVFKHALVQEVAYDSLLRSRRAAIHASVVSVLQHDAQAAARQSALLGYHCAQAGMIESAANFYRLAGTQAEERAAFLETRALMERGLALAERMPDTSERRFLEAELWGALARIFLVTKNMADMDVSQAFGNAIEKSRSLKDPGPLTRALYGRCYNLMQRGHHDAAVHDAQELMRVAGSSDEPTTRIMAHAISGMSEVMRARFRESLVNLDAAIELNAAKRPGDTNALFAAITAPIIADGFSVLALGILGLIDQAAARLTRTQAGARRLGPIGRTMVVATIARYWIVLFRDEAAFRACVESYETTAAEHELSQVVLGVRLNRGWLSVRDGHAEAGLAEMRAALGAMHAIESLIWGPYYSFLLADALTFAGRRADALASLDEGLALTAHTGEVWLRAELHRRRGELLIEGRAPDLSQAERELWTAIDVARGQSAKLFELRAATSLARLWSGQGRRAEARDLLRPIYDWFTEGSGSRDLQEAGQVLAELGQTRPPR